MCGKFPILVEQFYFVNIVHSTPSAHHNHHPEQIKGTAHKESLLGRTVQYGVGWAPPIPKFFSPPSRTLLFSPPLSNFCCALRSQLISYCHNFSDTRPCLEVLIINLPHCVVNQSKYSSLLKICTLVIMLYRFCRKSRANPPSPSIGPLPPPGSPLC